MTNHRTPKPRRQNDELLKGAFEENFQDFLRFLYPDADSIFDLDRGFQFMDKELLEIIPDREKKKGKRIANLLAKVYLKDGSEKWILVHTEIEAGSQEDFAFRMFQYYYRLLDRYRVPVETIAILRVTGTKGVRPGISIGQSRRESNSVTKHTTSSTIPRKNSWPKTISLA